MRFLWCLVLGAWCFGSAASSRAADLPPYGFNDTLLVPLRVHLLSSADTPSLHTTLADSDIDRVFQKVNKVWSQAGIQFFLEPLVREPALETKDRAVPDASKTKGGSLNAVQARLPAANRGEEVFNIYYIKSFDVNGVYFNRPEAIVVKDTASLRKVEGGIDEPLPRVTSHELGHAFTLPHRQDTFNLMASGTTGTTLNNAEILQARQAAAKRRWIWTLPQWQDKAVALEKDGKSAEALAIYRHLAALPLDSSEEIKAARLKTNGVPVTATPAPAPTPTPKPAKPEPKGFVGVVNFAHENDDLAGAACF